LFGAAVNKALKSKKGLKRTAPVRHLDESGADLDEMQAFTEYCKGDYEANRADDEDDVGHEQVVLEDREETEAGQAIYEEESDAADTEDEEEEEEDDEDGAGEEGPRSGLVSEGMEESARELQKIVAGTGTGDGARGGAGKRDRDYDAAGDAGNAGAGGGPADGGRAAKKARAGRESRAGEEEAGDYELSDEGVRAYITNVGGKVPITDLREVRCDLCTHYKYLNVLCRLRAF
jgi:hypothetical protein